jgi:hypothetical protein
VIDVQRRNAPGAGGTGAGLYGAAFGGPVSVQVFPQVESGGRLTAQAAGVTGREIVQQLADYTRKNGPGWMRGLGG